MEATKLKRYKALSLFMLFFWAFVRMEYGGMAVWTLGAVACLLFLVVSIADKRSPFFTVPAGIGFILNQAVVLANGGYMPGLGDKPFGIWTRATAGTKLYVLADIHQWLGGWYSLGDVFLIGALLLSGVQALTGALIRHYRSPKIWVTDSTVLGTKEMK